MSQLLHISHLHIHAKHTPPKNEYHSLPFYYPTYINLFFPTSPLSSSLPKYLLIQGYLSFWNDNISYALRGCILIELALRRRIALVRDANRRQLPLSERVLEVIDERSTGETLLDEALKMMKAQEGIEKMAVNTWIDLLSGEHLILISCFLRGCGDVLRLSRKSMR